MSDSSSSAPARSRAARDLAVRTAGAVAMIGGLAFAFWADAAWIGVDLLFQGIVLGVGLLGMGEVCRMMRAAGLRPLAREGAAALALLALATWAAAEEWSWWSREPWVWVRALRHDLPVLAGALGLGFLFLRAAGRKELSGAAADLAATVFGLVYAWGLPIYFITRVRHLGTADGEGWLWDGYGFVLAVVLTAKASDIFAYLGGRLLGKHRMTPRLSPGKTWEGFACGLAGSTAAGVGFFALAPLDFLAPLGDPLTAACFGLTVGAASVAGDLSASLLKRASGVKDSGGLVPGYGGVIDVIDSMVAAAPVGYLFLYLCIY